MAHMPSLSSPSNYYDSHDLFDVVEYGADYTGTGDCTAAISSAIAAAWSRVSLGLSARAVVYFPGGTYLVTGKVGLRQFDIGAMHGLSFIGAPGRTQINMTGSAGLGDWYLFQIRDGSYDIEFRDLSMDMAITSPDPGEQNHLIQIGTNANRIRVIDCKFTGTVGDGIRMFGEFGAEVRDVEIRGCTFEDCGRAGVSFQRWVRDVRLTEFSMFGGTDQQIDFEPTGYGLTADAGGSATSLVDASASFLTWGIEVGDLIVNTTDSVICAVTAVTATTLTLSAGATSWSLASYYFPKHCSGHLISNGQLRRDDPLGNDIIVTLTGTYGCILRDVVMDGCIQGVDVLYGTIEGCILNTRPTTVNATAIQLLKGSTGTSIRNNKLWLRNSSDAVGRGGISVAHQIRNPDEVTIEGNDVYQQVRGVSISVESSARTRIRNNSIILYTPSDSINQSGAITVRATAASIGFAQIVGNDIRAAASGGQWSYGVQVSANPNNITSCEVGGGCISNCNNPLAFSSAGGGVFSTPPIIHPVSVSDGSAPLVPAAGLKWFQLGGVGGVGAGGTYMPRQFWGDDSPEGVLTAPVGSIAQRRNGGAATTLYVKESGTGNTGWVAK